MGKARQRARAKARRTRGQGSRPSDQPVTTPAPDRESTAAAANEASAAAEVGLERRVELPHLLLDFVEGLSPDWIEAAKSYWAHVESPNGNSAISWTYKVKDLSIPGAEAAPLQPSAIIALLAPRCTARLKEFECKECGEHLIVTSRAAAQENRRGYWHLTCDSCRAERASRDRADREAEQRAKQMRADRQRAAIDATPVEVSGGLLQPRDLTLAEALVLRALLVDGTDEQGVIPPAGNREYPLLAVGVGEKFLAAWRSLHNRGIIRPHPSSNVDAFRWTDDDEIAATFLYRATWYVAQGPEDVSLARASELNLGMLTEALSSAQWQPGWSLDVEDLAHEAIAAEAHRYFMYGLGDRTFPDPSEAKEPELVAAMIDAARDYSIGEIHYLSWKPLQDASDAYRRHDGMTVEAATSHAVNQVAKRAPLLRSKGWQAQIYEQPWQLPLAACTQALFGALGLDPGRTPAPKVIQEAKQRASFADIVHEQYDEAQNRLVAAGPLPNGVWEEVIRTLDDASKVDPEDEVPSDGTMRLIADTYTTLSGTTRDYLISSDLEDTDQAALIANAFAGAHLAAFGVARLLARDPWEAADAYKTATLVGDQLRIALVEAYMTALTNE